MYLGLSLLLIGLFGLACSTFATALIAEAAARFFGKTPKSVGSTEVKSFQISITAHNEEKVIEKTLNSILKAAEKLPKEITVSIVVGLDHCTDSTETIVDSFAKTSPIQVIKQKKNGVAGKWQMLVELIAASSADWIAFVDCGSIWSADLLVDALPEMKKADVVAVAPSYMPSGCGKLESLNWKLEQNLKSIETKAGGPVSVHGATILYKRKNASVAFEKLKDLAWMNDDVVVPLTLRLEEKSNRTVYLHHSKTGGAYVTDLGIKGEMDVELRRRGRMAFGNLQWISLILLPNFSKNPLVSTIASRRLFRVLWAYWVSLAGLGMTFILSSAFALNSGLVFAFVLGVILIAMKSNYVRRVSMAFISGLKAPLYLKSSARKGGIAWN